MASMPQGTNAHWSAFYDQGRDFRLISSPELDKIISFVDSTAPKTALDIGCGTGQLTRELYHRGYTVLGVDASTSAIDRARTAATLADGRLLYLLEDFERDELPMLALQSFGLITCKLVYAFIKDKQAFLERVHQLLAPGGSFVIITPMPEDVPEKPAIAATADDVALLSSSFKQVALYKENGMTYFVGRPLR